MYINISRVRWIKTRAGSDKFCRCFTVPHVIAYITIQFLQFFCGGRKKNPSEQRERQKQTPVRGCPRRRGFHSQSFIASLVGFIFSFFHSNIVLILEVSLVHCYVRNPKLVTDKKIRQKYPRRETIDELINWRGMLFWGFSVYTKIITRQEHRVAWNRKETLNCRRGCDSLWAWKDSKRIAREWITQRK